MIICDFLPIIINMILYCSLTSYILLSCDPFTVSNASVYKFQAATKASSQSQKPAADDEDMDPTVLFHLLVLHQFWVLTEHFCDILLYTVVFMLCLFCSNILRIGRDIWRFRRKREKIHIPINFLCQCPSLNIQQTMEVQAMGIILRTSQYHWQV